MKKILKALIMSSVEHMDVLITSVEKNKGEIASIVTDIIKADKAEEDCTEYFNSQRMITVKTSLLEQDLIKVMSKVNIYYNLSISGKIDLELEPKLKERLDFIGEQETTFYMVEKGEVKPRDEKIFKALEERVKEKQTDIYKEFLTQLRNSPMYKGELPKPKNE